eukprot:1386807-Ditylum_brightwellii.AAC.1
MQMKKHFVDHLENGTMDSSLLYCHNPHNPSTFDNSQHVQWTPTEKTAPVKVKATDGSVTWQ